MKIPEGWPTEEMVKAGERVDPNEYAAKGAWVEAVLQAALSAAPTPITISATESAKIPRAMFDAYTSRPEVSARWIKLGAGEYKLTPCLSGGMQLLVIEPVAESHPIGLADASEQDRPPFTPTEKDTVISFGNVESAIFFRDQVQSCVDAMRGTSTPPEVEPIYLLQYHPSTDWTVIRKQTYDGFSDAGKAKCWTLFTSPPSSADDELIKAAEELVKVCGKLSFDTGHTLWPEFNNLRAALNKRKS